MLTYSQVVNLLVYVICRILLLFWRDSGWGWGHLFILNMMYDSTRKHWSIFFHLLPLMKRVETKKALLYLIAGRVNFCSWHIFVRISTSAGIKKVLASGRPSVGDELSSGEPRLTHSKKPRPSQTRHLAAVRQHPWGNRRNLTCLDGHWFWDG